MNTDAPAFYRSPKWHGLRGYVRGRDWRLCQDCEAEANQVDRVIPGHAGGADAMSNLVAWCRACKRRAGEKVFASFEAKRTWILAHRDPAGVPVFPPLSGRGIRQDRLGRS